VKPPGMKRSAQPRTACCGVALLACLVLLSAGCGGSKAPTVANIATKSTPATATGLGAGTAPTSLAKGNPNQLLEEWAACMRNHGDPNQPDPTIDSNKVIHITYSGKGLFAPGSPNACPGYIGAATTALRGGRPLPKPDPAKLLKFSECMRANGIPDFPDPSNGGLLITDKPGSDLAPSNPTFQNASKLCAQRTGLQGLGGTPQPGAIEVNGPAPGSKPG
jgi:hypothetical protein